MSFAGALAGIAFLAVSGAGTRAEGFYQLAQIAFLLALAAIFARMKWDQP